MRRVPRVETLGYSQKVPPGLQDKTSIASRFSAVNCPAIVVRYSRIGEHGEDVPDKLKAWWG
jgi:hypothetical protein